MFSSAIRRLNDRRDAAGETGEDAGFTLIELMVVLLILAILLAIAIPTFLGVTKSANDRAAQSNLNTALTNAKALYQSQGQSYTNTTVTNATQFAASVQAAEPSLTFGATNSGAQGNVSVAVSTDGNALVLAAFSKSSNNCWYIIDNPAIPQTATLNVPWTSSPVGGSVTASGSTTAGALVFPATLGETYAEAKGDSTATDCNANAPKLSGSNAVWQYSQSSFPS